ncbi:EamA family transporter RarD [Leptothoe spongobia]|uniref:EamA family transporter RarD n=1 Tax=Leptothoe spongobia TAU-MAC 1115 TaxID=1967444 RepID=A0A947DER1_9CYAN|nr:EamA family transporter RarD [Leptothoe spongobia]MBT9315420.1 EamA family transporter RarD [Leptothoe spongobia TAU-MAC 1115]
MNTKTGPIYAVLAYGSWGLLPIYWKFFGSTSPLEVLSHRMLWSLVFLSLILALQRRLPELRKLPHRQVLWLLATALLLSVNWGLYIYGVNTDRVVETSLGYFINPLVSVMLGFVVLKERLYRGQQIAVVLATIGVGYFIWQFGSVPWIALGLAGTFALYGLLRKMTAVAPMVGLAVETGLMTPVVLLMIFYWGATGTGSFGSSPSLTLLFIGAGVATSMPLLWFNNAAKRLSLSTLGFFQYVAPSIQLMLGVFLYQEPFTQTHLVSFSCIWTALLIYSSTSLLRARSTA